MELSKGINQEVLNLVNKVMEQRGIKYDALGRQIGLTYSGIYKTLMSKKLTVNRLKDLSLALQYNFFAELSERFELKEPDIKGPREKELEARIYELEIENRTLMRILKKD